MEELLDPIIDRLLNHKELITQVRNEGVKNAKKIEEVQQTVFNSNNKLDIFDQITIKIAKAQADVKVLEDKVDYENKNTRSRMEDIAKLSEIQTSSYNNLRTHTREVMDEISKLKDVYRSQCESFVAEV